MRYTEILEACWKGYRQAGMKKKGDRQVPNCVPVSEQAMEEDLKKWFKEKWVRFGPDGKIRGDCARGSSGEGKPKCLPQAKAQALGKKGRASSAAKKRREDPDPERRGKAKNVATKVREQGVAEGKKDDSDMEIHQKNAERFRKNLGLPDRSSKKPNKETDMDQHRKNVARFGKNVKEQHYWDDADEFGMPGSEFFPDEKTGYRVIFKGRIIGVFDTMPKATEIAKKLEQKYGGQARVEHTVGEAQLDEKQDACYRKVKSRYKVWPSAYASGALVQCRKKGSANWGNKDKK
jgi:hypothetical protein